MDGMTNTHTTAAALDTFYDVADTDDDTLQARIGGLLIKLANPFVQHYHSDFVRDAQWVARHLIPEIRAAQHPDAEPQGWTVYYSVDSCGTLIGFDPSILHSRQNRWTIRLRTERRHGGCNLEIEARVES